MKGQDKYPTLHVARDTILSGFLLTDIIRRDGAVHKRPYRYDDEWLSEELIWNKGESPARYKVLLKQAWWSRNPEINSIHGSLQSLNDIATVFTTHGYPVQSKVIDYQLLTLPKWLATAFGTSLTMAKTRTSEISFMKGNHSYSYGVIFEVFSPVSCPPEITDMDQSQLTIPSRELFSSAFGKEEIWASLLEPSLPSNLADRYPELFAQWKQRLFMIMKQSLPVLLAS